MQKRKQIDIQAVRHDERRTAYRRTQTQAHTLGISVRTPQGEEHLGLFQDLSVGGASAKFVVQEHALVTGQIVVLTIGSFTRADKVVVKARVMFNMESKGGRHCGFQFTEPAALAKQIGGYYARFFNRRKGQRVGVPLDKKIPVSLFHSGAEIQARLLDLSVDGMQVRAPRSKTKELDGANHAFLRFQLPGQRGEIAGRAAILRRSQDRDVVTLGLAFDLTQKGGIVEHMGAVTSWIVHRTNEIARWDSSLPKGDAA